VPARDVRVLTPAIDFAGVRQTDTRKVRQIQFVLNRQRQLSLLMLPPVSEPGVQR